MMHLTSSPVHMSGTSIKYVTSRFSDNMPRVEFDESILATPCDRFLVYDHVLRSLHTQHPVSHAVQPMSGTSQQYAPQPHPTPVPFSTYPFNPYPAYINQYNNQQYATQHMTKVISPDDTAVFVSDGQSWKEYNLEKVFSW